jgi:hypothetical protein
MKMALFFFMLGAISGAAAPRLPKLTMHFRRAIGGSSTAAASGGVRAHTEERFLFTAHAPMERVAPLFGADRERVWAPGWEPEFLYPLPAMDKRGMVFTVPKDHRQSVWVNTEFNLKDGRIQYAYVIPETLATLITIQLTPEGVKTRVEVEYARTALSAEGNTRVQQMAEEDRNAGPEWEAQVNGYLKTGSK